MVVHLIAKDEHEKFQFRKKCRLMIDSVSKLILVESFNEEFKPITFSSKCECILQQDILFIFAEHVSEDFAIIFDNDRKCKKVYAFLLKHGAISGNQELIKERFLHPFFNHIRQNNNSKMKDFLVKWIKHVNGKDKAEYIQLLKSCNIYNLIFSNEHEKNRPNSREQKARNIYYDNESVVKNVESDVSQIIEYPNFKIFHYKHKGTQTSKLVVFCETNKNLCYEYSWNPSVKLYQCSFCNWEARTTATICQRADAKDYLSLGKTEHVCNLCEFDPEKYRDDVMVDKTMYKFITSKNSKNPKNKILQIFSTAQKGFYYKFYYHARRKHYFCPKCQHSKVYITATIQNEGKENEFLYVSNQKHVCEPLEYFPLVDNNVIKAPNYQFVKRKANGKIMQRIVVFTNAEKTQCYEYTWMEREKYFQCFSCNRLKIHVIAKSFKNKENEECIELSSKPHKCKPIKFVPENITPKIVKIPDFKLYEAVYRGKNTKKLAVSNYKNFWYVYTYCEGRSRYICCGCKRMKKTVTAKAFQDKNGESYVELCETEHVCEPTNNF